MPAIINSSSIITAAVMASFAHERAWAEGDEACRADAYAIFCDCELEYEARARRRRLIPFGAAVERAKRRAA